MSNAIGPQTLVGDMAKLGFIKRGPPEDGSSLACRPATRGRRRGARPPQQLHGPDLHDLADAEGQPKGWASHSVGQADPETHIGAASNAGCTARISTPNPRLAARTPASNFSFTFHQHLGVGVARHSRPATRSGRVLV